MIKKLFLLLILSSAIIGSLNFYIKTAQKTSRMAQNVNQSSAAIKHLMTLMVKVDGQIYAPEGKLGETYTELPDSIVGSRVQSNGAPFMYCPFSMNATQVGDSLKNNSDLSDTPIQFVSGIFNGASYVIRSEQPQVHRLLAAIIEVTGTHVACRDISLNSQGGWTLTGESEGNGIVHGIHADALPEIPDTYTVNISPANAGTKLLDNELNTAFSRLEKNVIVNLTSGSYELSSAVSFMGESKQRNVIIQTLGDTPATITGNGSLSVFSSKLTVKKVAFNPSISVVFDSSDVIIQNSSMPTSQITKSTVNAYSSEFVSQNGSGLTLFSSSFNAYDSLSVMGVGAAAFIASSSDIKTSHVNIQISSSGSNLVCDLLSGTWESLSDSISIIGDGGIGGVSIGPLTEFNLQNSSLLFSGVTDVMLYVKGEISVSDSSLQGNALSGLWETQTGTIKASNFIIGNVDSKPTNSIWYEGGILTGNIHAYSTGTCLSGPGTEAVVSMNLQDQTVSSANPDGSVNPITVNTPQNISRFELTKSIDLTCN